MKKTNIQKLAIAGLFCALAVVGSLFSFPVFGSRCAPVQHMVNVLCAVILGPGYGVTVAFTASLIRNILGLGSLMAFPGSMFGAFISGIAYKKTGKLTLAFIGEVAGTSILGGLAAYPVAKLLMGLEPGGFTVYMIPFFISTLAGSILAYIVLRVLEKSHVLEQMREN